MDSENVPEGSRMTASHTPRAPPLSLEQTPKPTLKRFKSLVPRYGPKDDPFRRAQLDSSPLVVFSDDEESIFDTPRHKKSSTQRKLWNPKEVKEEEHNDDELASLLANWQAFVTPEKAKQVTQIGSRPEYSSGRVSVKGSPLASSKTSKTRGEDSLRPFASPLLGKTLDKPDMLHRPVSETSSPKKRRRQSSAEPTLKRARPLDEEDDGDVFEGLPPWTQVKRAKLFATPVTSDRCDRHGGSSQLNTPPSSLAEPPSLPSPREHTESADSTKKKNIRLPQTTDSGLETPVTSATESSSPVTPRHSMKLVFSPKKKDQLVPSVEAPAVAPALMTSLSPLPTPVTTPRNVLRAKDPNSTGAVRPKRKRSAQDEEYSSDREDLKRMKFAKLPFLKAQEAHSRPIIRTKIDVPRCGSLVVEASIKGKCTLARLIC